MKGWFAPWFKLFEPLNLSGTKGGKELGSDGVEELPTPISAALFLTGDLRDKIINFLVVPT